MARLSEHPSVAVALARLQEGLAVTRIPLTADQCAAVIDELELRDAARADAVALATERLSNLIDERQRANRAEADAARLRQHLLHFAQTAYRWTNEAETPPPSEREAVLMVKAAAADAFRFLHEDPS